VPVVVLSMRDRRLLLIGMLEGTRLAVVLAAREGEGVRATGCANLRESGRQNTLKSARRRPG
jgi:hypothetical protein